MINTIVMMKREKYKAKRVKLLERKEQLKNEGKHIEALAIEFAIDQVQETLTDLLDMENEIKNYERHTEMCVNLITKNKIKNGIN